MQTSARPTSNILSNHHGFSLIEIMVALLLAALVFIAIPSGDSAQQHRNLKTAIDDVDRAIRFASNEAVLRNTVVRLRLSMDKEPVEYTVEYGPAGNIPLPDMPEKTVMTLSEQSEQKEKSAALDKQFTKVGEFEDIKHEIHPTVLIAGVATTSQNKLISGGEANIYFYPTGEKDGAIIFFSTSEEIAFLEIEPFLTETRSTFEVFKQERVAKVEDIVQTRMDEVYKQWIAK